MISEADARQKILELVQPLDSEEIRLGEALGAFSAEDAYASVPIPGFDNSMMDGYAVVAPDTVSPRHLSVISEQPAGRNLRLNMTSGEAIRIFTGAPMPKGASAVIMQEDVHVQPDGSIVCQEPVEEGENVRRAGADLCQGQKVLSAGQALSPARLALLASQGRDSVKAVRRPRVAILSTGDELIPPGAGRVLADGEVFNSNGVMIESLCRQLGVHDLRVEHCPDDFEATVATLDRLMDSQDAIILSGGVSVGDHDHVRPALKKLGVAPDLWRVRVKPGKPFLFAQSHRPHPVQILGLPGNPVSSFVTFFLFVRGALLRMMGAPQSISHPSLSKVAVGEALENDGNRPHYLRGRVEDGVFFPQGLQQSHALATLAQANALLRVPEQTALQVGSTGQAMLL